MRPDFPEFLAALLADPKGELSLSPIPMGEAEEAENRLGVSLPLSYKFVVAQHGAGIFAGQRILRPMDLYAFGSESGQMEGLIGLVGNLSGCGDYLALNPCDSETAGERPMYYCSQYPYGYARLTDSFEAWIRRVAKELPEGGPRYGEVDEAINSQARAENPPDHPTESRPWWKLW